MTTSSDPQALGYYRSAGLLIASTVPLGGLAAPADPGIEDLRIDRGTPDEMGAVQASMTLLRQTNFLGRLWVEVFMGPNGYFLRWPERLELAIDAEGRWMLVRELGPLNDSLARLILVFGLSYLLPAHGIEAFHASSVEIEGRAVVVCGHSGFGKSTTATALCLAGGRLLSDDLTVLRLDETGVPLVEPVTTKTMLHRGVADLMFAPEGLEELGRNEKVAVVDVRRAERPVPVAQVFLLKYKRDFGMEISEPLAGTQMVTEFLPSFFNQTVKSTRRSAVQFRVATELVAHATVRTLTWEPNPDKAGLLAARVMDELRADQRVAGSS